VNGSHICANLDIESAFHQTTVGVAELDLTRGG